MKNSLFFVAALSLFQLITKAQTQVTFYTTLGNFNAEMHDSVMPITAGNFTKLVDSAFYDGIIFHRVITNFVVQGGDPLGTGYGGPGYTIPDEFIAGQSNLKQTLSMANSGPNSGGSQFFINLKNNTFLDFDKAPLTSQHPVFGKVYSGWTVVEAIENTPVDGDDRPLTDVVMDSVRITGSFLSEEELRLNKAVSKIYPNPINQQSILDVYTAHAGATTFELRNANGSLLSQQQLHLNRGKNKIPLREIIVQDLQAGVYFLSFENENLNGLEKFIVLE